MNAMLKKATGKAFQGISAVTSVTAIETVRIRVEAGALPSLKGITDKKRKDEIRAERQRLIDEIFAEGVEIQRLFPAFNLVFEVVRSSPVEGEANGITIHSGRAAEEVYKKEIQPTS